jgi:hypothetical protein
MIHFLIYWFWEICHKFICKYWLVNRTSIKSLNKKFYICHIWVYDMRTGKNIYSHIFNN